MNQLAIIPGGVPAHLAALAPAAKDPFLAGIPAGGPSLPALSIKGKAFSLRKDGQTMSLRVNTLPVILTNSRPATSKRYYEGTYNPEELAAPRCWSIDGVTPQAPNPCAATCAACPMNAWGSRGNGTQAKACSDYKRVVVIPLTDSGENFGPCMLDLSATSLKTPKGADPREMQLREYVNMLAGYGRSPAMVVTALSFTFDDAFPRVCFTYVRDITAEEARMVVESNARKDVLATIEGVEEHEEGAVAAASPIPAPALAAPPAAHLQGLAVVPPAATPAEVSPEPVAAPAPAKRTRKPKVEAVVPVAEAPGLADIPAHMATPAPAAPAPAPAAPAGDADLEALLAELGI